MMVQKVLYITYDGLTDPLGQSQVLPYLCELSKGGYQFTILSFEKKDRLAKEKNVIENISRASGIRWVPLLFTSKPPVLSKMWDRYKMHQKAVQLYKEEKFHMVHCRSYVAAETGLELKKKFGIPFLFDMRGFWADEKVDNGQWDMTKTFFRRLYKHYKEKEAQFLLNAAGIISLTEAGKKYLLKQEPYKHLDISVIPCCADLGHFNYERITLVQTSETRRELGIPATAKVVTYLGSIGGWYLTGEMFRFLSLLQWKHPEYVMLFLTKDNATEVKKEAIAFGLDTSKMYITYSPREKLPFYLALTSFSIFFIKNSFSKIASSPTKHAELMGMGIPVVCNNIGDTGHIIDSTGTGFVIDDYSEASFLKAINKLNQLEGIDKPYIRKCATEYFDLSMGVQRYAAAYKNILTPLSADI